MAQADVYYTKDSTTNLVENPNPYPTRWAKVLGAAQVAAGVAAIGLNVPAHSHYGHNLYGVWCGIIFIVAGVVQIMSGRSKTKAWIGFCFILSVLAAAFGVPVVVYSAKSIRSEFVKCEYCYDPPSPSTKKCSLFGVLGLVGVVEMGVAVASAVMACKAFSCSLCCVCPYSSKISDIFKRFVDKEKNNPLRAVRLGKTQIVLGLLAMMFNAAGIGVLAKDSMVGQGFWCGIFFILAGCFLHMSTKNRPWILVSFVTLLIAIALTIPLLILSINGLIAAIKKHAEPYYEDYYYEYHDYDPRSQKHQRIVQIISQSGLIAVAAAEFFAAFASLVQVGKCFRCDGNFKFQLGFKKKDKSGDSSALMNPSQPEVQEFMREMTSTMKEMRDELAVLKVNSAPKDVGKTMDNSAHDEVSLA